MTVMSMPAERATEFPSLLRLLPLHSLASGWKKSCLAVTRNTFIHYDTDDTEDEPQRGIVKCRSNFLDGLKSNWSEEPDVVAHVEGLVHKYSEKDSPKYSESPKSSETASPKEDGEGAVVLSGITCALECPEATATEEMLVEAASEELVVEPRRSRQRQSEGSALHDIGACKPCAWNWKPGGCEKSWSCTFCHMCDEDALKQKRKGKLERQKEGRRALRARTSSAALQSP